MNIYTKIKHSFTLIEILTISSLIALIIIIFLIIINPKKQIEKTQDAKRKAELSQLQKALEDWNSDKGCYPKPNEICYNQISSDNACNICGNESTSPPFSPYLQSLPCDPQHPEKKYLYQVDDFQCPKRFWIYAKLSDNSDPIINQNGCTNGCGPENNFNLVYTSPNVFINNPITITPTISSPTNTPIPTPPNQNLLCNDYQILYILNNSICNNCGSYQQCLQNHPERTFYIDYNCSISCIKN